ncbi:DUF6221 family protein [Nonomuraea sp. NPDC050786]|uniref:DUF6221 family protein n=1 Tax=Nonomuraea sp. NPDC050786 TaxID=3154840 RepID=UPI003400FB5B
MDLIKFLRARLDEDEELARAAGNRHWLVQDNTIDLYPEHEDDGYMRWPTRADARHAAHWEPARVLREVEAKRALIKWVLDWPLRPSRPSSIDGVLERLALAYSDHPDYRDEWKP